ncbi:hypothetical protein C2G38_2245221 [Gigaspora rosea]|uniref:Uncharacterized protein n=1 Tax=Gigaspora rosea TaxID=44941 RepID=A0A397VD97_9GLOM|nr:hypothetical protein C2G38_2245221 [Gigaspora rosea]
MNMKDIVNCFPKELIRGISFSNQHKLHNDLRTIREQHNFTNKFFTAVRCYTNGLEKKIVKGYKGKSPIEEYDTSQLSDSQLSYSGDQHEEFNNQFPPIPPIMLIDQELNDLNDQSIPPINLILFTFNNLILNNVNEALIYSNEKLFGILENGYFEFVMKHENLEAKHAELKERNQALESQNTILKTENADLKLKDEDLKTKYAPANHAWCPVPRRIIGSLKELHTPPGRYIVLTRFLSSTRLEPATLRIRPQSTLSDPGSAVIDSEYKKFKSLYKDLEAKIAESEIKLRDISKKYDKLLTEHSNLKVIYAAFENNYKALQAKDRKNEEEMKKI